MDIKTFKQRLRDTEPGSLAGTYLKSRTLAAFSCVVDYDRFISFVQLEVGVEATVAVVGSGNWGYSLNPDKVFKPYDENSDIDVAIVSLEKFQQIWDRLRGFHRSNWWAISYANREQLRRNGENIYCGFVSPSWLPDRGDACRYAHKSMLNRLSKHSPGRRQVKVLYFKDEVEAVDYYKRGFVFGRRKAESQ